MFENRTTPSRREILAGALAGAAIATASCSSRSTSSPTSTTPPPSPVPTTPAQALDRLLAGNKRWVGGELQHLDRDPTRREFLAQEQRPFGVVLSCIDSRVPPELVFDTGLGDLYVMRTGAQVLGPVVTASVEYGPLTSGTPLIVVLGHQRCGAVAAAEEALRTRKSLPGNLQTIAEALRPAYDRARTENGNDTVDLMARAQAELTAEQLRDNNDLAPMVSTATMAVVAAYYSLDTGQVDILSGAPT